MFCSRPRAAGPAVVPVSAQHATGPSHIRKLGCAGQLKVHTVLCASMSRSKSCTIFDSYKKTCPATCDFNTEITRSLAVSVNRHLSASTLHVSGKHAVLHNAAEAEPAVHNKVQCKRMNPTQGSATACATTVRLKDFWGAKPETIWAIA